MACRWWMVATVFALGACADRSGGAGQDTEGGSDTAPVDDDWDGLLQPVAGSRLRPIFRTADDGTRVHVAWQDTMFDSRCRLVQANGALRCVPDDSMGEPWLYADPECTQPVAMPQEVPQTGRVLVVSRGCGDNDYYEVGEATVDDIYYTANGPCERFGPSEGHARVTPLDVGALVSATAAPAEGDGRIVPIVAETGDGARQILGAWDHEHGEEVAGDLDGSGQARWFGRWEAITTGRYFADASCSDEAAFRPECTPADVTPATARAIEGGGCGEVLARYRLAEPTDDVWVTNDGSCGSSSFNPGAWRLGEPLIDEDFAAAPLVATGGSRLRHDHYATPEGEAIIPSLQFVDAMLPDAACDFRETQQGDLACVPHGATITNSYVDASCSQQIAYVVYWECEPPPPVYAIGGLDEVAKIAGEAAGWGAYMLDPEGACVPDEYGPPGGTASIATYLVGDTIPIDGLVHATDVIE